MSIIQEIIIMSKKKYKPQDYVSYMESWYSITRNSVTGIVSIDGIPATGGTRASVRLHMAQNGFTNRHWVEDALSLIAEKNTFCPYELWLGGIEPLNNGAITELASKFTTATTLWERYLTIFLVGALRRITERGAQNPMLVLNGAQGIGKSLFAQWLSPHLEFFVERPINPDSREDDRLLGSKLIWEAGELGATTRRSDVEALKAFMTKRTSEVRRPYDVDITTVPALASFIGTVNPGGGFLNDASGSRRFHVADIQGIDWTYRNMDKRAVWGNAYHLLLNGYSLEVTEEERAIRNEQNAEFAVDNPIAGYVGEVFVITGRPEDELKSSTIIDALFTYGYKASSTAQCGRDFSEYAQQAGIMRKRRNHGFVYTGIKKKFTV